MKKRTFARLTALLAAVLVLLALAGCGGGSSGSGGSYANYDTVDNGYAADYDSPMEEAEYVSDSAYYGGSGGYSLDSMRQTSAAPSSPEEPAPEPEGDAGPDLPRKLIRRASLNMETTTFDESAAALTDLVNSMGGYFSDASSGDQGGSRKRANYTIRIPARQFDAFLAAVGDICHETWRDVTQDDISERYYDTQGRLRTQNTKLTRLQELLTQAQDMEDIITIQSAISETEERIEELQGTLSHWDNQVDYATISLTLSEVYRLSNTPPVPETFVTRLGAAFTGGISDFAEWVGDLIISLAYSWLWWLLLALIVVGILRLRRSNWWQKKREAREARRAAARQKAFQSFAYNSAYAGQNGPSGTQSGGDNGTQTDTDNNP